MRQEAFVWLFLEVLTISNFPFSLMDTIIDLSPLNSNDSVYDEDLSVGMTLSHIIISTTVDHDQAVSQKNQTDLIVF